jgi:hypothetical protein
MRLAHAALHFPDRLKNLETASSRSPIFERMLENVLRGTGRKGLRTDLKRSEGADQQPNRDVAEKSRSRSRGRWMSVDASPSREGAVYPAAMITQEGV